MRRGDETIRASNASTPREEVRRKYELVATNVFETESLQEGEAERGEEVADEEAVAAAGAKQAFQVVVDHRFCQPIHERVEYP